MGFIISLFPWFIVYDIRSILSCIRKIKLHLVPISLSFASNVAGFGESKLFMNSDPKDLFDGMMTYMESNETQISNTDTSQSQHPS